MKKLLVGLLAIGSLSTFAANKCRVSIETRFATAECSGGSLASVARSKGYEVVTGSYNSDLDVSVEIGNARHMNEGVGNFFYGGMYRIEMNGQMFEGYCRERVRYEGEGVTLSYRNCVKKARKKLARILPKALDTCH